MALPPSLSKNYCTRANVPFPENTTLDKTMKSYPFLLKEALKDTLTTGTFTGTRHANSVWTVVGSSDGVTAALDGVDRWGTTFDVTKLTGASSGTVHSWIILQNTTLGAQLLIDLNSATPSSWRCASTKPTSPYALNGTNPRYSPTPPTGSGNAISFMWGSGSTDSVGSSTQFYYYNTQATGVNWLHYVHVTFDESGQFYFIANRAGDGYMNSGICFLKGDNANPADQHNAYLIGGPCGAAPPWPGSGIIKAVGGASCMSPDATQASGGIGYWSFAGTATPDITTYSDRLASSIYFYPWTLWTTSPFTYRGKMPDTYGMIGGRPGILLPNPSSPKWITLNGMMVPYVGVPPLL